MPEYPGIWGTAFAISYYGQIVFLTAKHLLRGIDEQLVVSVPTLYGRWVEIEMEAVSFRSTCDPEFSDVTDVAILYMPTSATSTADGTDLYPAGEFAVDMAVAPTGCPLVVRGYPREHPGNFVNVDERGLKFHAYSAQGYYRGPSGLNGMHKIDIDLTEVGGPQGFSGSPVFAPVLRDGEWWPGLAGMVLRGGGNILHFLDVKSLYIYLQICLGP